MSTRTSVVTKGLNQVPDTIIGDFTIFWSAMGFLPELEGNLSFKTTPYPRNSSERVAKKPFPAENLRISARIAQKPPNTTNSEFPAIFFLDFREPYEIVRLIYTLT